MSLLSFIAFPREVDTSCLKSMIDRSKLVKVKDLKGSKWEKNYIGLSDNEYVYIGNPTDSNELQVYKKDPIISFKRVFDNQFIYSINAQFINPVNPNGSIEEIFDEIEKQNGVRISKEEYIKQVEKYYKEIKNKTIWHMVHCRKQLYDLVKHNTNSGETVEIFSSWVRLRTPQPVKLGPPKETRIIDIEEVLISELLDLQSNLKIEILV